MPKAKAGYVAPTARVPRTIFEHAHNDGGSSFPPLVGDVNIAEVFIRIPTNFNGLNALKLWLLASFTDTADLDITIDIGTCGELYTIHTQTVNNTDIAFVQDTYRCVDLTAIFAVVLANLASNDMIWIKIGSDQEISSLYAIGAEVIET